MHLSTGELPCFVIGTSSVVQRRWSCRTCAVRLRCRKSAVSGSGVQQTSFQNTLRSCMKGSKPFPFLALSLCCSAAADRMRQQSPAQRPRGIEHRQSECARWRGAVSLQRHSGAHREDSRPIPGRSTPEPCLPGLNLEQRWCDQRHAAHHRSGFRRDRQEDIASW